MATDSSIPRDCFLDLMGPPNCLSSMSGNPGTSRDTSAVQTVQGDLCTDSVGCRGRPLSWMPGNQRGSRSSCIVCIPSFARADGSVSCFCHTEPLARTFGELPPSENWLLPLFGKDMQDFSGAKAFRDAEVIPSFEYPSSHHSISVPTVVMEQEYILGNIPPVSPKHPSHTCPNGSSVRASSIQRPCNLLDEQCFTELKNLPLQITDTLPPSWTASLYDSGRSTSFQSIQHPSEDWGTNYSTYLTELDIDLLETSDNTISQSARSINWCETDALIAPDPHNITSRNPSQTKNVRFASILTPSALQSPDCFATRAQSRPETNAPRAMTSNFSSLPNEVNDSSWTILQPGTTAVWANKEACARQENTRTHDDIKHEPSDLHSFEFTAGSPVANPAVASKWPRSRRFQCSYPDCTGRSFSRRSDRDRHMRKHSATERRFVCTEPKCGKRFYRKDKLLDHSRHIHCPEKPACICAASRK